VSPPGHGRAAAGRSLPRDARTAGRLARRDARRTTRIIRMFFVPEFARVRVMKDKTDRKFSDFPRGIFGAH
jgi:hypothetical protein